MNNRGHGSGLGYCERWRGFLVHCALLCFEVSYPGSSGVWGGGGGQMASGVASKSGVVEALCSVCNLVTYNLHLQPVEAVVVFEFLFDEMANGLLMLT